MNLAINDIKANIDEIREFMKNGITDERRQLEFLRKKVEKQIMSKLKKKAKFDLIIRKRSVDGRKGLKMVYSVELSTDPLTGSNLINCGLGKPCESESYAKKLSMGSDAKARPVIIGFGPSGMFCAYMLAKAGLKPIVYERGYNVDDRTKAVEEFWSSGKLDENSNVQFGEGGAGTFSDGKLTSRSKDPRVGDVLEILYQHGASEDIRYMSKPHVGTDVLKGVVKNIREKIIQMGGEVHFNSKLVAIEKNGDDSHFALIEDRCLESSEKVKFDEIVIAIGHSARDTFRMLDKFGINMSPKPFAVGVRVEHPRSIIDESQYNAPEHGSILGASEYFLTHNASNGRSAYTFCMCPGGIVVPSSSRHDEVVTNGMSYHDRGAENSNSALLVNISPGDYLSFKKDDESDALSGVAFQEHLERNAFEVGGCDYRAPAQYVGDFLKTDMADAVKVEPSYSLGVKHVDMDLCLPDYVTFALREALVSMGTKISGFDMAGAVLTGVETRTSSPLRIVRDEVALWSTSSEKIFPCGEGAGYAGGIVSSAIDGMKIAEKIIGKYSSRA